MRRIISILFLVTILRVALCAQVIYRISGGGATAPSYLFATNQLTPISFLDSIPNLFKCYAECTDVVTEFAMQDYAAIAALRTAALLPDSVRLRNFYTEDEYQRIDEALRLTLGMGLDKLGRMKPSHLTEMYRVELLKKWADYDDEHSSQHFFEAVAESQGKPVHGLDDIGETMYMLFDREPFHWQCTELLHIIDYPEREVKQAKALRDLYQQGRLLDLSYQVSGPDNQSTISYSDYQVYCKRNKEWVNRLRPYLRQGSTFIVLDATYIGGDKGLIALLREAGYRVKPVNRR